MVLNQLQLAYQMDQDRILFRASSTQEDQSLHEHQAWLTRRLVKSLWPGIVKALETQVTLDQPQAVHAKAEIIGMKHQATMTEIAARGDFAKPFQAAARDPLTGATPMLVSTAHFTLKAGQPLRINFASAQGHGFEIVFTPPALHGFCTMLQTSVKTAQWDITLQLPGTPDATGDDTTSRVLN
jgi:hypothetical protein